MCCTTMLGLSGKVGASLPYNGVKDGSSRCLIQPLPESYGLILREGCNEVTDHSTDVLWLRIQIPILIVRRLQTFDDLDRQVIQPFIGHSLEKILKQVLDYSSLASSYMSERRVIDHVEPS